MVCGVNDERIQRQLLAESQLDFKKALELATAMEIVDNNTGNIRQGNSVEKPKEQPVNRLSKQQGKHEAKECYRCGGKFHEAEKCRYKDEKYYQSHKKGHKAIKCRANPKTNQRNGQKRGNTHHMETTGLEEEEEENGEEYTMFRVVAEGKEPYCVVIDLHGISTSMEVDTGAAATIISKETFKEINQGHSAKKKLEMKPAHVKLRTYTGELVKVLGTVDVVLKYEGQKNQLSTLVVEGSGPSFLGRDWLKEVKLDWKKLFKMNMDEKLVESRLEKLINQCLEVFEDGLGTFTGPKAKILVEVDAVPKFCKANLVPYAMKGKIEEELKRLQEEGTIESVQFSEWAAPIVPFMKHVNFIRICGDYKTS